MLLFYVLVFCPRGMWDLSSPTRGRTCTPCIGRRSLNHWTAGEVLCPVLFPFFFLQPLVVFLSSAPREGNVTALLPPTAEPSRASPIPGPAPQSPPSSPCPPPSIQCSGLAPHHGISPSARGDGHLDTVWLGKNSPG